MRRGVLRKGWHMVSHKCAELVAVRMCPALCNTTPGVLMAVRAFQPSCAQQKRDNGGYQILSERT